MGLKLNVYMISEDANSFFTPYCVSVLWCTTRQRDPRLISDEITFLKRVENQPHFATDVVYGQIIPYSVFGHRVYKNVSPNEFGYKLTYNEAP